MWGWPVGNLLAWGGWGGNISTWARTYKPDIVLMQVGFPEIVQRHRPTKEEITELSLRNSSAFIDTLRVINPEIIVVFANVYHIHVDHVETNEFIEYYNSYVPAFVEKKNTEKSPVIFIDIWSDFDPRTDMVDWLHANGRGCKKIAVRYFDAIRPFFSLGPPVSAQAPGRGLVHANDHVKRRAGEIRVYDLLGRRLTGSVHPATRVHVSDMVAGKGWVKRVRITR